MEYPDPYPEKRRVVLRVSRAPEAERDQKYRPITKKKKNNFR